MKFEGDMLRIVRDKDVVVAQPVGVFSGRSHRLMRDAVREELLNRPTRAVMLDMRFIVNCMTDQQRTKACAEDSVGALRIPLAMVVSGAMLPAATSHCAEMWTYGFFWVPFLDLVDAREWARRRRPQLWTPTAQVDQGSRQPLVPR